MMKKNLEVCWNDTAALSAITFKLAPCVQKLTAVLPTNPNQKYEYMGALTWPCPIHEAGVETFRNLSVRTRICTHTHTFTKTWGDSANLGGFLASLLQDNNCIDKIH